VFKRFLVVACVSLVLPAAAAAAASPSSAQQQCTKLRTTMGATAFTQAYPSFGSCVSKLAPVDQGNNAASNAQCQAEQSDANFASTHSSKTFDQFYGTGKSGKNAFGNCVSAKVKSSVAVEQAATPNPAQTCRAERTSTGSSAFDLKYKTFGKCVSTVAKAQVAHVATAASQCRSDATVTSSTEPNAFAKCVVAKAHALNAARQA
jgi:hypothetical protein